MEEAYENFARVYDLFMDNIDYPAWCRYLTGLLEEYQVTDGLVLELGCGTGTMTELLAGEGYDMIGVDNSEEMLEEAMTKDKKAEAGKVHFILIEDVGNVVEKKMYVHDAVGMLK